MTFSDLKKSASYRKHALFLEDIWPSRIRRTSRHFLLFLLLVGTALVVSGAYPQYRVAILGAVFFLLFFAPFSYTLEAFYFSRTATGAGDNDLEVDEVVRRTDADDIVRGFVLSSSGEEVMLRAGMDFESVGAYLRDPNRIKISSSQVDAFLAKEAAPVTLEAYARAIASSDSGFAHLLETRSISVDVFAGAAKWVAAIGRAVRQNRRWWSREYLERIPGIAKDWAYGNTYRLGLYGRDVAQDSRSSLGSYLGKEETDLLEKILSRGRQANAIIVGDDLLRRRGIISEFARRIGEGIVPPSIEHKRLVRFDTTAFLAASKEKSAFENEWIKLMNETVQAGNVIFLIDSFSEFLEGARRIGADPVALMTPYLEASSIQIIVEIESSPFQTLIQSSPELMNAFERILVASTGEDAILSALEDRALGLESQYKILFTYPALLTLAKGADRYFSGTIVLDKAYDLLYELPADLRVSKKRIVEVADVEKLLQSMSGIPVGAANQDEKTKLLDLEKILHARIVGQNEAINAISNALRRARSGIGSDKRPMGSFLFLGPTGMGKTETTKALAATFFGSESNILRLDMSEYRTADALERLIGSFELGKPGVLTTMLREHPYGVLLLDEFEKTSKDVLDLFLQVLDEGMFSDMAGKKVNARNLIIIATSNAGSDVIFEMVKSGADLAKSRDQIIDAIIQRGIFKPELINRFDGAIIFEPLDAVALRKIALLMLQGLAKRLTERGIELVINDTLLDGLVAAGSDPQFGARPMNRAVQDKVEQAIAKKLLAGTIHSGSRVELTAEELK